MMPQHLSCFRIQRVGVICAGHQHDPCNHDRGHLKHADSMNVKDPLRSQMAYVFRPTGDMTL